MTILETERLLLREQNEGDTTFILALMNSPGWLKYIGDRGIKTEEDARKYILDKSVPSYKKHGFGFYLTELKEGSVPIGICGLVKRDGLEHVDIGFAFLPEYEGRGYGVESASAVMIYAKTVLGIDTIAAITTKDNGPSINLVKKIGLHFKELIKLPGNEEELMLFESRM